MPKKNSLEVFLEKNSTLLLLLSIVVIVLYLKYTREGFGKIEQIRLKKELKRKIKREEAKKNRKEKGKKGIIDKIRGIMKGRK